MGNGGSGYYPGVDPDGAGGLIVSGSVLAHGVRLDEPLAYASVSNTGGQSFADATSADFIFDHVLHTDARIAAAVGSADITCNEAGLYALLGYAFTDDGLPLATGTLATDVYCTDGTNIPVFLFGSLSDKDTAVNGSLSIELIYIATPSVMRIASAQTSGVTRLLDCRFTVVRLGQ